MICTCLPTLRVIIVRIWPQLHAGTTKDRSEIQNSRVAEIHINYTKRSSMNDIHLSELEAVSGGHTWTRIGE
jgi:hypothetical protein